MATITVQSNREQERKVFRELEQMEGLTREAIRATWFMFGDDLKNRANSEILRKPKRGQVYLIRSRSGNRSLRRHVASAPGETHANMFGDLRRAISWQAHGNLDFSFGYGLNRESPEYDEFVEFGTKRMFARPSLENAINFAQANVQLHFDANMFREFGS